ncbi:MAG: HAMP domain-containing sensor histidine kinase, partial [Mariprofundaceae bacterium]
FFIALLVIESTFYALTGHAVSMIALLLAALIAVLLFPPLVGVMQERLDRLFFRQHVDALQAIRHLGAGDLAELPNEDIERALLERICMVCHRDSAALIERQETSQSMTAFPEDYAPDFVLATEPSLRLPDGGIFELCFELPFRKGRAWLCLQRHRNGLPTDDDEVDALRGLARFAAMSLEHARLIRKQADSARLDSLSRVAGQLHSHDLKNRLNDLAFLAHHIGSGKLDAEETERLVGSVRKVVGRMQTVMQRLADPQTPIHPKLAPFDISLALGGLLEDRLWPEGVEVIKALPPLPPIAGDEAMLAGVFENLFDNAVQAMQRKGRLHVSIMGDGASVEVEVRDDGCGMSSSFLRERIFHLFSSSKDNGLGIGLYLSRRVIEAHRGEINATSPGEGKGCTFHVRLPLWQSEADVLADSEKQPRVGREV